MKIKDLYLWAGRQQSNILWANIYSTLYLISNLIKLGLPDIHSCLLCSVYFFVCEMQNKVWTLNSYVLQNEMWFYFQIGIQEVEERNIGSKGKKNQGKIKDLFLKIMCR